MDQSDKLVTMLPKIQNGHSRIIALEIRIETTRCSQASVRASHRNFEDATHVATCLNETIPSLILFRKKYITGKHDRVIAAIVIADNSLRVSLLFTVTAAAT